MLFRSGIFKELDSASVKIDPYRRELQRAYLDAVNNKLNPPPPVQGLGGGGGFGAANRASRTSGDERPLYRNELRALSNAITNALYRTTDVQTKAHLEACKDEIGKILEPPASRTAAAAQRATAVR